jgi:hypothetical protein
LYGVGVRRARRIDRNASSTRRLSIAATPTELPLVAIAARWGAEV